MIALSLSVALVSTVSIIYSSNTLVRLTRETYISEEEKVSNVSWDEDEWYTYLEHFNEVVQMPEYVRLFEQTEKFRAINHFISGLLSTKSQLRGAEAKADELKHIADIDALTGAGNNRAYFEKEEELNDKIKEGHAQFAVCMIDLNDLKNTNDTFGHEAGDELIIGLCSTIQKSFHDMPIYRIGGDEFVVVLEDGATADVYRFERIFVTAIEQA